MSRGSIAVTGAAGFVGRNVVRALAADSVHVIGLVRPEDSIPEDLPAEIRVVDVGDPVALRTALQGAGRIVHLAARSGGIQLQEATHLDLYVDNRRLTDSVLRVAVDAGIERVFLASSAVVYRESAIETISEDAPTVGPADMPNGYAWSKVNDEVSAGWANRTGNVAAVIGRFGNVYGPEASFDPSRSTVIHALIARIASAPNGSTVSVWGDGTAVRSFINVVDVARAIKVIVEDGDPGAAYNVDTSEAITIRNLAETIRDLASSTVELAFDATKPTGVQIRVPDNTRLRSLGFVPSVPLVDGLKATIDWYRLHDGRR